MAEPNSQLVLPALRARMGIWVYYICFMRMEDIANRISVAQEIHTSESLRDLLQRQLTDRAFEISSYLRKQKQRFFNSLVVGTYGGNPKWTELTIRQKDTDIELPEYIEGALGLLILDGSERLFAIDGQHRVAGMKHALQTSRMLREDEVSVIFVAGVTREHRSEDSEGFERTRRLFTTLNRYAKPVSKKDIIALDEDDAVAIITRRLVEEHPLFIDKISVKQPINIPVGNKQSFTTIVALYETLDVYLRSAATRDWAEFKKIRPPDEELEALYRKADRLWKTMITYFPPLRELRDSKPEEGIAAKYRHRQGGHILFRPIGLLMYVRVMRHLMDSGIKLERAVQRLRKVPTDLANAPWADLLWDRTNRRMITAPENQDAATELLFHAVGGELSRLNTDIHKLKQELAGLLKREPASIRLPRYV